jgi:hypothetical protein
MIQFRAFEFAKHGRNRTQVKIQSAALQIKEQGRVSLLFFSLCHTRRANGYF